MRGPVRPPMYGSVDPPDPEPFLAWAARNPAKVVTTLVSGALAIWANFALSGFADEPRLPRYPKTATVGIETDEKVCWIFAGARGKAAKGCGSETLTLRRSSESDREFGTPAFFATVTKRDHTDVHPLSVTLTIDGEVVDETSTARFTAEVATDD